MNVEVVVPDNPVCPECESPFNPAHAGFHLMLTFLDSISGVIYKKIVSTHLSCGDRVNRSGELPKAAQLAELFQPF